MHSVGQQRCEFRNSYVLWWERGVRQEGSKVNWVFCSVQECIMDGERMVCNEVRILYVWLRLGVQRVCGVGVARVQSERALVCMFELPAVFGFCLPSLQYMCASLDSNSNTCTVHCIYTGVYMSCLIDISFIKRLVVLIYNIILFISLRL